MSDGAYSLWMALTCLALVVVLWLRFDRSRRIRRLLKELERQQAEKEKQA